jgi:hypothetical protein
MSYTIPQLEEFLETTEKKYGGLITNVPIKHVSERDPRSERYLSTIGMQGGDRMLPTAYNSEYAQHLLPFVNSSMAPTIVEVGILKGSGLALWGDLFPNGSVIGLDISLTYFEDNLQTLLDLGAFPNKLPEVFEFDQFVSNSNYLEKILKGRTIDIFVDDAYHTDETILQTLEDAIPFLSDTFVCFLEDNNTVVKTIRKKYPQFKVYSKEWLTILCQNS